MTQGYFGVKQNSSVEAVRNMLHEFLVSLKFSAMAEDVLTETDWSRLQRYAHVVNKAAKNEQITYRFKLLGLL